MNTPEANSAHSLDARAQTREVPRAREGLLQAIVNATREAIISIGENGLITLFNPAAERMFGRAAVEMIGQPLDCLMPEEHRQQHQEYLQSYFATGKPDRAIGRLLELPGLRANGEVFPMAISLSAGRLQNERFVIAVARDITDRKRAEEALRKERNFISTLVNSCPTFFVAISREGRTLLMNESMLAALGYREDEIVDTDYLTTCVPPSDREVLVDVFRKLTDAREPTLNENRVLTKDGRELLVEWHGRPVFDDKGELDFFFGVGFDVTERRKAEEERRKLEAQVQQAQKLESLGVLAGGIAHDFNNLLVGVLGNAELALDQLSPTSPARAHVKDIETAAMRAAELTRQMLAYSGKGLFVIERLNLNEIVAEVAHLLEISISKKAALRYNYADNLPSIEVDVAQVRQVIMNLITNASEALDKRSGVIAISTGAMECDSAYLRETYPGDELPEGAYVYLEVADTGCGMDEETRKKIFDPFFTTKFTGRGLGLAAVLGIMRGHKGALSVRSQPGRGSTFRALFPALDEVVTPSPDKSKKADRYTGTGTVLLVDDEDTVRTVGRNVLERAGFTALTATDGPEAIELFRQHADEIVCVVLDLTMPHMDGDEAFRKLREIREDVRVILSSGYNQQEITQRFAGSGLAGFIQKPYRGSELLARIGEIIQQRRSQSQSATDADQPEC